MWNEPTKEDLANIPKMGLVSDGNTSTMWIQCHFFLKNWHWYISEFDGVDTFMGFFVWGPGSGRWEYIWLHELKELKIDGAEVEFDTNWKPKPVATVRQIVEAGGCW